MSSLCLECSSEGLALPGGNAGRFLRLGKGLRFSLRNFPAQRCSCYCDLPPPRQLSLLMQPGFTMAFPTVFPSLHRAGFAVFLLFHCSLGIQCSACCAMASGVRAAGVTRLSPSCTSAMPGAPGTCSGSRDSGGGSPQTAARLPAPCPYAAQPAPCPHRGTCTNRSFPKSDASLGVWCGCVDSSLQQTANL